MATSSPSSGYSHCIEQQVSTTGTCGLFWLRTAKGNTCLRRRAGQGRGEQAHRVRSFLAGKAHSTKTGGQYLTGSQQSHTIHHALGPQAACTAQQETQDRHRAPGAPYLPPLQTEPCFSRSLKTVRHIPIASHRVPVSQQLSTPLSSRSYRTAEHQLLHVGYFTSVWERLPLLMRGHPGAARCPPARLVWKQMLPGLRSTTVPLLHTLQSQDSCTQATQTASTEQQIYLKYNMT